MYRARRTGMHGEPFIMFKYRTMVVNADRIGGTSTSARDPRITRVGHVLRRFKLDELPQLLNVVLGDLSLVGPRPEVEEYTSMYTAEEQAILSVRPGMTDLASIKLIDLNATLARAHDPDAYYREVIRPRKNELRLQYARTHTFWLDLMILARTARALVSGKAREA
jgi:lipopolysaccharide/colanic/teichoic acid biosynthesis glycosyltransferase